MTTRRQHSSEHGAHRLPGSGSLRWAGSVLVVTGATGLAVLLQWPDFQRFSTLSVTLVCLGTVAFAATGVLLWHEPGQHSNALLFGAAAALFSWEWAFTWPHSPGPFLALPVGQLFAVVLSVVLLRYPRNRLARPSERWLFVAAAVWTAGGRMCWALTTRPEWFSFGIGEGHGRLPASTWWITIYPDRHLSLVAATIVDVGQLLLVPAIMYVAVRRLRSESRVLRRELTPAVAGLGLLASVIVGHLIAVLTASEHLAAAPTEWVAAALSFAVLLIPAIFLVAMVRRRFARAAVADLIVMLSRPINGSQIQSALRRTLNDDSLTISYWVMEAATFINVDGHVRRDGLDGWDVKEGVQVLDRSGHLLAVVHLSDDHHRHKQLLEAALAASALALESARLEAALRAQLREVQASRSRIVEAGLLERRRMERDLHDGAQQQLLAISATITRLEVRGDTAPAAKSLVRELRNQVRDTRAELRLLARGLHPAILTQVGLGPALEAVAERLPMRINLDIPDRRWTEVVEATTYFVVCEALTNAVKHSHTDAARVTVQHSRGTLSITIVDLGCGGARFLGCGGLVGLRDRVQALGGNILVDSEPSQGTTVSVTLPCA